jgi:hypothetical protein
MRECMSWRRSSPTTMRQVESGVGAVPAEGMIVVKPRRTSPEQPQDFHLESRARHPPNLTGWGYEFRPEAHR